MSLCVLPQYIRYKTLYPLSGVIIKVFAVRSLWGIYVPNLNLVPTPDLFHCSLLCPYSSI